VIYADAQHGYAGEFEIVEAVDHDVMMRAFLKHALEGQYLNVDALQKAMREVGRRINSDEGERLVRSFDMDGNGGIEYKEFEFGLNNMVGMEMPHGLGQEFFQANSEYVGEFYEDKRHGVGILIIPSHHFYLGRWEVGLRHGRGIEGRFNSSKREAMLPRLQNPLNVRSSTTISLHIFIVRRIVVVVCMNVMSDVWRQFGVGIQMVVFHSTSRGISRHCPIIFSPP